MDKLKEAYETTPISEIPTQPHNMVEFINADLMRMQCTIRALCETPTVEVDTAYLLRSEQAYRDVEQFLARLDAGELAPIPEPPQLIIDEYMNNDEEEEYELTEEDIIIDDEVWSI